ncbi:heparinase II/III family protein [bacterium]|nr:heparinase II/III family protein [bacterium]
MRASLSSGWWLFGLALFLGAGLTGNTPAVAQPPALSLCSCDELSQCSGGELDTQNVKEGKAALRWDHSKSVYLNLNGITPDWKAYNRLSFWMYSPKATKARFMMIVPSENPKTEGSDYYMHDIVVDFTGWKQFSYAIPRDFDAAREPRGWDQIDGMNFTASGWDNTPDPNTCVTFDDFKLSWEAPPVGPKTTDAEFFASLNLDYPGLERTKALVQAGDLAGAKAAYVKYLKVRETPRYYVNWRDKPEPDKRPANPDTRGADQALKHLYYVCDVPLQFEDKIDWEANPTNPFNPEWTWQFGRHSWWSGLGRAYWNTGDEKYAQEWVWELRSWIHDNFLPERVNNSVGSRWRTIECGIRLQGSWPQAFYYFLSSPTFTDDDVVMMVKSMAEQAQYLYNYPTGGNWLTMEANGMCHVGVLFPEFKQAQTWREEAVKRLYTELDNQVYPDGAQKELTTGYHYVALGNFLDLARICMFNNISLPENYVSKLERMWAYGMWAMMPDRTLPYLNDAWNVNVPGTLRQALEYFPQREDFRWIATDGKEGRQPDHLSHFFPWAGWSVMRTGWGRDDNYMLFDVGPFGLGHQHEDKLAMVLSAYGKYLLVDVGSYAYERSAMRSYVVGPWAHNIVAVDGLTQARRNVRSSNVNTEPQTNPFHTTAAFDYCEGVYDDGFGPKNELKVVQRRQVLFVKPEYWVVVDTLTPPDAAEHQYASHFHLGTADAQASGATASTLGDSANLHILTAGRQPAVADIVKGQETPYYLGWIGTHGVGNKHPMPVARFTWKATGVTQTVYLLYPTRPGQECPVRQFHLLPGDGLKAEIQFADGRRDVMDLGADWQVTRYAADGAVSAVLKVEP